MNTILKKICVAIFALAIIPAALGACTIMNDAAGRHLGEPCDGVTRVLRAEMLTNMLEKHYGGGHPITVHELRSDVERMQAALSVGASLDAPGDAYKAHFVQLAAEVLAVHGIKLSVFGFREAVAKLSELPALVAEINIIQSAVELECAKAART